MLRNTQESKQVKGNPHRLNVIQLNFNPLCLSLGHAVLFDWKGKEKRKRKKEAENE